MPVWHSSYSPSSLQTDNSGDAPYPMLVYQSLHHGRLSLKIEDYFCTPLRKCPPGERDVKFKERVREYVAASTRLDNVFFVDDLREWTKGDENFRELSSEILHVGYLLVGHTDGDLEVRPSLPMCSGESHPSDYQGLCDAHRSAIETWATKPGSACIAVAFMKRMMAYADASDDDFEARGTTRDNDTHKAARRRASRLVRALLDKGFVVTRERCVNWPAYDAVNSVGFALHGLLLPEPLHPEDLDNPEDLFFDAMEDTSVYAHNTHLLEQCRRKMKDINEQHQHLERAEKMVARLQVHAKRVDGLEKRICDRSAFLEKLLDAVHCAERRFGVVIEHDENEPVERGLVNAMGYLIRELAKERMANNRRPADGRRVNGSAAFFDAYMEARKRHCRASLVTHASAQTDEREVNYVREIHGLRKDNAHLRSSLENAEKANARLNEEIALLREQLEKVKTVKREKAKTRKTSNDD